MGKTIWVWAILLTACTSEPEADDAHGDTWNGPMDSQEVPTDSGPTGAMDTGEPAVEVPLDGFGTIDGDCGVLDAEEWTSSGGFLFQNTYALPDGWAAEVLTGDAQEVLSDGNLGGSSVDSEAVAMELLARCELADLLLTEGEVDYDTEGKKTDLVVQIDDLRIGVSVVRAYQYPPGSELGADRAEELLEDKLADIQLSSGNVSEDHAWERQILFVVAYNQQHADQIQSVWDAGDIDGEALGDTIVVVTATGGENGFLF